MQKAAKEKVLKFLIALASVLFLCAPSTASSTHVPALENRVELFLLGGENRTEQQAFGTANRVENYDSFWGVAIESPVAPKGAVAQAWRNLGAPTPTFSLVQRWKLWGKHRDTLTQLKKATPRQDVLLSDITSDRSLAGITKLMGELTAGGGKEIGLLRTRQGLVLRQGFVRGGKQYLDVQGASRVIAHSHPNGRIGLSADDRLQIFGDLGQKSTIILGPKGFWRRIADDLSIVGGNF